MNTINFYKFNQTKSISRVFLFYPPGAMYQRGEDRSQGNISDSVATSMRAPNDMGYASSILKKKGNEVFFRDYQTEELSFEDLKNDFIDFNPSVIVLSITNSTINEDIKIATNLKSFKSEISIVLKGALFFDLPADSELFKMIDFSEIDYLIGGESEFAISDIVDCHISVDYQRLSKINGIFFRGPGREWIKTDFSSWEMDIDSLPYPDREEMKNKLYVRPDTGKPQATIATSRGCPAACIYCLTPKISGKQVRFRSSESILGEMRECYFKHGISDFFFKSDTFTIDANWVKELCDAINASDLSGKINWVANSRVKPLADDTLKRMKEAGCWLVAFGFESGSSKSLKLMKKGATSEDNLRAARLAKEAGLEIFGFYLIGLPWENMEDLEATKQHIYDINADYIELHIAVPYLGTELHTVASSYGVIDQTVIGKDYFNSPTIGTKYVPMNEIMEIRRGILLKYHTRPLYVLKKFLRAIRNPVVLMNYTKFGLRLIKNNLFYSSASVHHIPNKTVSN